MLVLALRSWHKGINIDWHREYKLAVLTYKARQSGSPSYLASLISDYVPSRSLRSSDKLLLGRPYTSLVMADKAFSVCAPKIWNDLSFNCRAATTVNSFKRNLKRELFYTARTLITPSNSRLSRLRFRFFAWTYRRVTNWFWLIDWFSGGWRQATGCGQCLEFSSVLVGWASGLYHLSPRVFFWKKYRKKTGKLSTKHWLPPSLQSPLAFSSPAFSSSPCFYASGIKPMANKVNRRPAQEFCEDNALYQVTYLLT